MQDKYIRQTTLEGFGVKGQQALKNSKVLIIGAGGLGCPVFQYLSAMGVGSIGIVDFDTVSLSNLHRQTLFDITDVGKLKVEIIEKKRKQLNPDTHIETYPLQLQKENCLSILKRYDVIVDCSDNFPTRYMVNDACVLLKKPLVYGAVSRYEGQVSVLNKKISSGKYSANYRDLYPDIPHEGEVLNCSEAGILGVLPGIIGTLQAAEVVKLLAGIGEPLQNKMLCYHMLSNQFYTYHYKAKVTTSQFLPSSEETFLEKDYGQLCSIDEEKISIDVNLFRQLLSEQNNIFIDVREKNEKPEVTQFRHQQISMNSFKNHLNKMSKKGNTIFFCQTGKRSFHAAILARDHFKTKDTFFSLEGGIQSFLDSYK